MTEEYWCEKNRLCISFHWKPWMAQNYQPYFKWQKYRFRVVSSETSDPSFALQQNEEKISEKEE